MSLPTTCPSGSTRSSWAAGTTAWSAPPTWPGPDGRCWCSSDWTTSAARPSRSDLRGRAGLLSRYSYLVSLMPRQIIDELELPVRLVRRRYSSYTPVPGDPRRGLLVDTKDDDANARSFADVTGSTSESPAWQRFYEMTGRVARGIFPTMTEPLRSESQMRALVGRRRGVGRLGARAARRAARAHVRRRHRARVALTDGLIGTFASADAHAATEPLLPLPRDRRRDRRLGRADRRDGRRHRRLASAASSAGANRHRCSGHGRGPRRRSDLDRPARRAHDRCGARARRLRTHDAGGPAG